MRLHLPTLCVHMVSFTACIVCVYGASLRVRVCGLSKCTLMVPPCACVYVVPLLGVAWECQAGAIWGHHAGLLGRGGIKQQHLCVAPIAHNT